MKCLDVKNNYDKNDLIEMANVLKKRRTCCYSY